MQSAFRQGARAASGAALLLSLTVAGNARAAELDSWLGPPTAAIKAVSSAAGSAWSSVTALFVGGDPYEYLPGQLSDDDRHFIASLDALGLQLSEIKVGGGTFSHSSYRFVAARAPSDVDVQRAERKLEDYRSTTGGLRAGAKQRIVRSLLDLSTEKGFVVTAVVVDMWPWPSVSYEISARNRPPEASERRIIDAAQAQ